MFAIQFGLDPIDEVLPWGTPPNLRLHWFGLTQGYYLLRVNEEEVLRYADDILERGQVLGIRGHHVPYLHYYVSRLHEDLIDRIPNGMQVVPEDIADKFREVGVANWTKRWIVLAERTGWENLEEESPLASALEWSNACSLDTRYMTAHARIWFYRCRESVIIEWAEDSDSESRQWKYPRGIREINAGDFESAVRWFDSDLMSQMKRRIEEVGKNWNRPEIALDRAALELDHQQREAWLEDAFVRIVKAAPTWNWGAIRIAINAAA